MTKQEQRTQELRNLRDLYRVEFKDLVTLGTSFDVNRLPALVKDCVNLITAKTPSFSNVAALNTVNYALAHVVCQTRLMIDDPVYASSPIGTNYYALTFAKSGGGKSSATNSLVGRTGVFKPAMELIECVREEDQAVIARGKALKVLQKDEPSLTEENLSEGAYLEFMEPLSRTTTNAKSSRGGIAGILTSLSKERFGSLGITIDELGMTIQNGKLIGEVMEILTEVFDVAIAEAPAYKTLELQEQSVEGIYTNLLAHTSPKIVFSNPTVKSTVDMMFSSAFARRAWFVFSDADESAENDKVALTIEEADELDDTRRKLEVDLSLAVSDVMSASVYRLIADQDNRLYAFTDDAVLLYKRYFTYCKTEGKLAEDSSLHQLEIEGRSWRIGKLCGVWAASIGQNEITIDLLESAIYFAEWNARYLHKFHKLMHDAPYKLLADSLKLYGTVTISDAITDGLIVKASPLIIQETLTAMNSYLNSNAVITYDKELNSFIHEELAVVTTPVEGQPSTFTMSYNMVKEPRSFADAPDELTDKQKADWVKEPRTHLLAEFGKHRTDMQYPNLVNIVTKDTVFNVFKYGPGATKSNPDVPLVMYRSNATIVSKANLIVIDVDDSEVPLDVVAEFLTDRQYLIATSSNKLNRTKFRILLPINVELEGSNSTQYAYIVRRICADLLIEADPKSFCPSQAWYGYANSDYLLQDTGPLFDVTEYLVDLAKAEPAKPTKKLRVVRTDKTQKTHMNKLFSNVDSEFAYALNPAHGQGSYTLARACLHLIDEGATAEEMERVILYLNSCWDSPMPEERIHRTLLAGYSTRCTH